MERRTCNAASVRIESRGEGQPPVITGYAARYYDPNTPGTEYVMKSRHGNIHERIKPGAFDRALAEGDVVGLFNHDTNYILGRQSAGTLRLSVDGLGLRFEIDPPDTGTGRDLMASLKRGDVSGSSFSFAPRTGGETWRDAEIENKEVSIRELTDVALYDVGPVVFPAYKAASSGVRADSQAPEEIESALLAWRATMVTPRDVVLVRARMMIADIDTTTYAR